MDLWVDAGQGAFGLEAEPSYENSDPKAVDFTLDSGLRLEVINKIVVRPANTMTMNQGQRSSTASVARSPVTSLRGISRIRAFAGGGASCSRDDPASNASRAKPTMVRAATERGESTE